MTEVVLFLVLIIGSTLLTGWIGHRQGRAAERADIRKAIAAGLVEARRTKRPTHPNAPYAPRGDER